MATNAHLSARLLRNAAAFFRNIGEQNPELREQLDSSARTYELVAGWVESDPTAESPLSEDGTEPI